jgi:hypothetical protein
LAAAGASWLVAPARRSRKLRQPRAPKTGWPAVCGLRCVVVGRARAAEPQIDTAPRL